MHNLESQLVGVAGEYLVAGELTLRGYLASITLRNSRGIDIISSNAYGTKSVTIQVKTNSSGTPKWILTKKSEEFYSDNHFYVFVAIGELGERPTFHIVPSIIVANTIKEGHREWLNGRKKNGTKRKDSTIRNFYDLDNTYLEQWDILNL